MPLILWKDTYSVNVKEIDKQHQKWIGYINTLHDAMKERKGKDVLGDLLDDFITYSEIHFKTEEKYFEKFNYLGSVYHKAQHKFFIKKTTSLKEDFAQGKLAMSIEVMRFLKDWLIDHICDKDKKYSKCFNDNGLE